MLKEAFSHASRLSDCPLLARMELDDRLFPFSGKTEFQATQQLSPRGAVKFHRVPSQRVPSQTRANVAAAAANVKSSKAKQVEPQLDDMSSLVTHIGGARAAKPLPTLTSEEDVNEDDHIEYLKWVSESRMNKADLDGDNKGSSSLEEDSGLVPLESSQGHTSPDSGYEPDSGEKKNLYALLSSSLSDPVCCSMSVPGTPLLLTYTSEPRVRKPEDEKTSKPKTRPNEVTFSTFKAAETQPSILAATNEPSNKAVQGCQGQEEEKDEPCYINLGQARQRLLWPQSLFYASTQRIFELYGNPRRRPLEKYTNW